MTDDADLVTTLKAVRDDLSHAKAIITAATDRLPDGYIRLGLAEGEAADALTALSAAPSLPPSRNALGHDTTAAANQESALAALADTAHQAASALIDTAGRCDDPSDAVACLRAAVHLGNLRDALR